MKKTLTLAIILTIIIKVSAQVGIGGSPNSNSILDLTNSGEKYLLMPSSSLSPTAALLDSSASMIYFNGNLYFNNGTSINTISPWDWDGTTTGSISSPAGASVGIGITPSSLFRLQVADAASGVSLGATNASIGIGNNPQDSMHLEIDNNEIMVKKNSNTADTLRLQKEGGILEIGMLASATSNTLLRVNGDIDAANKGKIKENGFDLLPSGAIIMWNNLTIPSGWELCDGLFHTNPLDPTDTMTTPDLRERFIVGAGGTYSLASTGGTISSTHDHSINLPVTNTNTDGEHTHTGTTGTPSSHNTTCASGGSNASTENHTHAFTIPLSGAHSHSVTFPSFTTGTPSNIENRPPYYALVYIMKY